MTQEPQPDANLIGRISEHVFDAGGGSELVETHISQLAFVDGMVHKRKKAVRFPFVDLSSMERRVAVCDREVMLNRRFSPDVYVGVEDVVDDDGNVVDRAVLMRSLPADRRMSTLIERHIDVRRCLDAVARVLADCHSAAERSSAIAAVATPAALGKLWRTNLDELEQFSGTTLDSEMLQDVTSLADEYIGGRSPLLAERIKSGRIVDGHGDLLPDDIFCLDDGPRILDCLEFDDHLRWGDVLYDVCFLAMDLERLGRIDLAAEFLACYRRYSAENHPRSLEHHYVAYRALVRAKVSCLKAPSEQRLAAAYLAQCHSHLLVGRVRLVVVGGRSGTGKSTLAATLAEALGWTVLRSDELRKQRAGLDVRDRASADFGQGLYTQAGTAATYRALCDQARQLLCRGESVVLDATFASAEQRAMVARVATAASAAFVELCCVVPSEVATARIVRRVAAATDSSDVDVAIAVQASHSFEDWSTARSVDTTLPLHRVLHDVIEQLGLAPSSRESGVQQVVGS